jgi:hypothetical protein
VPEHVAKLYGSPREIKALLEPSPPYGPLWVREEGGYRIPDWLEYNPTREEILVARGQMHSKRVAAGRLGGLASGEARAKQTGSKHEANGHALLHEQRSKQQANRSPTPPHTNPTEHSS